MKKKLLSIMLAGTLAASVCAVSAVTAGAEELAPGDFGKLGEYTPTEGVQTQRLLFAMPNAWQNDTTKNEKCGGAAGIYWWTGFDTPDNKAGGHGWPGYKSKKVVEDDVDCLYEIQVPCYGNGEKGNATMVIWNNYLDGGMETDPVKNPFYAASQQTKDFPGQYLSRTDDDDTYDVLFRYIYKKAFVDNNIAGADTLDIKSDSFWVDANKIAAAKLGKDYEALKPADKTFQVDNVLDDLEVDLSEFGSYASNFFNEDLVGDEIYPKEESNGFGETFHFDNMVFVVNFDPSKMIESPVSHKIGYDGNFYFYYGKGNYGSWPTKELNDKMKAEGIAVVEGNFTSPEYQGQTLAPATIPAETVPNTTKASVPSPSGTDAKSSSSDSASGSSSNSSNGAVATGQMSLVAIVLVVVAAGIGFAVLTRKKYQK